MKTCMVLLLSLVLAVPASTFPAGRDRADREDRNWWKPIINKHRAPVPQPPPPPPQPIALPVAPPPPPPPVESAPPGDPSPVQVSAVPCPECSIDPSIEARLDQNIVKAATGSLGLLQIHYQAGTLSSADIRQTAVNVKTFRDHIDQIGLAAAMEKSIHAAKPRIVDHVAGIEQVTVIQRAMAANGVPITLQTAMGVMMQSPAQREAAFASFDKKGGVNGVLNSVIHYLHKLEDKLYPQSDSSTFWPTVDISVFGVNPFGMFDNFSMISRYRNLRDTGFLTTREMAEMIRNDKITQAQYAALMAPEPPGTNTCEAFEEAAAVFSICCYFAQPECCALAAVAEGLWLLCKLTGGT